MDGKGIGRNLRLARHVVVGVEVIICIYVHALYVLISSVYFISIFQYGSGVIEAACIPVFRSCFIYEPYIFPVIQNLPDGVMSGYCSAASAKVQHLPLLNPAKRLLVQQFIQGTYQLHIRIHIDAAISV